MSVTIAIGATLFLGAFYSWTGRINSMFFFGRSGDAELRDGAEGRAITRQYLALVIATTVVCCVIAWFARRLGHNLAALGPLTEAFAFWGIFARANRQVRDLEMSSGRRAAVEKSVVQVALLETPRYSVPSFAMSILPAVLAAVAFVAALSVAAVAAGRHATDLGAGWMEWNAAADAGHLDSLCGLSLGLLGAATGMLLVFRSSVRLRTNMAQYTVRACVAMEWIGLAVLLAVLGCNYTGVSLARGTNKGLILAGLAAAFATLLWNQARAKRFVPPPVEMGADDRWRWGLFYVDHNDPALFVQSRCGAGYTLNYGRMLAWPISLAMLAYVVVLLFLPLPR